MKRKKQCPPVPTIECQLNCPYARCDMEALTFEEIKRQDEFDKKENEAPITDAQRRNKEKQKIRSARHYQTNKEKIMQRSKAYIEEHKEEIALKAAETRKTERYRAQRREYARRYRAKHRDKYNEYQREYRRKKSTYVTPEEKVYEFIKGYFLENKYAPSNKEIAEGIGIKQPTDIKTYLLRLKDRGLVEGNIGVSRAFRMTCFDLVEKENEDGGS